MKSTGARSSNELQWLDLWTHWGRVTHICVGNLTIIGPDYGLSPGRRQAIIWTNAGILLTRPLGTNFSENLVKILTFSFTKMRLKVSSAKRRPFCLGLNVLKIRHQHGSPSLFPRVADLPHYNKFYCYSGFWCISAQLKFFNYEIIFLSHKPIEMPRSQTVWRLFTTADNIARNGFN